MIVGFDHVVIAVRDPAPAVAAYETLLGRRAIVNESRNGASTAIIGAGNIAVEVMAPKGAGETADRLRAALDDGEGLKSLVFATDDIERAHRRCGRVGLDPEPIAARETWRSFRLSKEATNGVRLFIVQRDEPTAMAPTEGAVNGLDHIVVRASNLERAAALYGARLGLDMRLDREVMGRRLMFFCCGDAVLEIAHDADAREDRLWGLSWRVADADAERARLAEAGVSVSEMRTGIRPGTRVFTVRDGACAVPTLMIETEKRSA